MNPEQQEQSGKKSNILLGAGLAVLFAAAAFFSGLQVGTSTAEATQQEAGIFSFFSSAASSVEGVELSEFWRVWKLLDEKFVSSTTTDPLTNEDMVQGAIRGLVGSYGDPYTTFLPPADATQFEQDISGNFGGVGMEVGIRNGIVTVIAPLPNTPAEKAGVVAGDVIVKIDDTTTEGMGIDAAVRLIRGEKGTEVVLSVFREGETEFVEITITRDTITIPTIATETVDGIFIVSLYSFNALANTKMKEALQEFSASGSKKLILDLRGNPGGFLQSAVSIAGLFLDSGKVVVRESFGDNIDEQTYRSTGKKVSDFTSDDFVVLVNGGSASASEILAGALKEHNVATLIGQTTFGKGSVQELVDLPSGASLKVTVARWFTPDGTSISDGGLEPNIEIKRTPQQVLKSIDPQKEAALLWLSGMRDFEQFSEEKEPETEVSAE